MRDRNNLLRPRTLIFYKNWTIGVSWPEMDHSNPILALSAQKRSQNGKMAKKDFLNSFTLFVQTRILSREANHNFGFFDHFLTLTLTWIQFLEGFMS